MVKFLLVVFLLTYAFYKVGGFIFKMFASHRPHYRQKRPSDGNVDVKFQKNSNKDFRGGEYVDFEEVE